MRVGTKPVIALCAVLLIMPAIVSVAHAPYGLHITYTHSWKTFSPYTSVLGQLCVRGEAETSGGEDPNKVEWEIVVYGNPMLIWKVKNGEWQEKYRGSAHAYKYENTYYVGVFSYCWSMSQYLTFDLYIIRLVYDGQPIDFQYGFVEEIPWP